MNTSSVQCLFMSLAHFLIVCFLQLAYESSLYILDASPLLDKWFATFSESVACLFIPFIASLAEINLLLFLFFWTQPK